MFVTTPNQRGYIEDIQKYLDIKLNVINRGNPGESAESYFELDLPGTSDWLGTRDSILPGDYVFIGFGHNKKEGNDGDPETDEEYRFYLDEMVKAVKAKGATPILITPMARMMHEGYGAFTGQPGQLIPKGTNNQHGNRPQIVRSLAQSHSVVCLDLFTVSFDIFNGLPAAVCNDTYGDGQRGDMVHLGDQTGGSDRMAKVVADLMKVCPDEELRRYVL